MMVSFDPSARRMGLPSLDASPLALVVRLLNSFVLEWLPFPPPWLADGKIPLLYLKRKSAGSWEYSINLKNVYLDVLNEIATSGTTFKDKNALLPGVGKESISVKIMKGLLSGGAHTVITTSRCNHETVNYYHKVLAEHGSRSSALTVVPFKGLM